METDVTQRRRGRPPGRGGGELLAIARDLFVTHGYRKTTMDAVAARARISKQSLYSAHRSKDALYAAVVADWVDQGFDALLPHLQALRDASDVRAGLEGLAGALQAGVLSAPVLQMRRLVAAEAETFPDVAADYVMRSWDRNLRVLADTLDHLVERGLLRIANSAIAAEQFVWLVLAAPLNRLSLQGGTDSIVNDAELRMIADEAVVTFLTRYGVGGQLPLPRSHSSRPASTS